MVKASDYQHRRLLKCGFKPSERLINVRHGEHRTEIEATSIALLVRSKLDMWAEAYV